MNLSKWSQIILKLRPIVARLSEWNDKKPNQELVKMIEDLTLIDALVLDVDEKYKTYLSNSVFKRFNAVIMLEDTLIYQEQLIESYRARIKELENELEI